MLGTQKARERRFHHGYVCPRCQSASVQRWGRERTGIQRDRCVACAKTFNDLTRTAMAGTHMPEKWRAFTDTMRDGLSTRRAAARVPLSGSLCAGCPKVRAASVRKTLRLSDSPDEAHDVQVDLPLLALRGQLVGD